MKYTERIVNSFYSTQRTGMITGADIVNRVVDKETGDAVKLYMIIEDGKIMDAKFQACGAVVLFASMSAILDIAIGGSLEDALTITEKSVIKEIKQVNRCDYSVVSFAVKALNISINNYLKRLERGTVVKSSKPARIRAINPADTITVYKEAETAEFENVYSNMLEETATEKDSKESVEQVGEVKIEKFVTEPEEETKEAKETEPENLPGEAHEDFPAEDIEPTKIEVRILEQEESSTEPQDNSAESGNLSKEEENTEKDDSNSSDKNDDVIDEIDSITAKLTDAITKLNFKFDVDGE